jgi:taurine--2-oxoglutarate transaminase
MSFFTNGGAEANENAIKLARWYTGRHKIVARYRSYHGATAGRDHGHRRPRALAAEPGIPGVVRMLDPYTYRCPAATPTRARSARARRTSRRSSSTRARRTSRP